MGNGIPEPSVGELTFDAEGQEGGPFHSRHFHVPSSTSGLTIGRGYDMKMRSRSEVRDDLVQAGVSSVRAALISQAAGLKGDEAEEFLQENELEDFEITPEAQVRLFEIEYQRQANDTRRLATKADVTRAYGATDWDALHDVIKEILVDLRFRGDYTPSCRKFLQTHVARNDLEGFIQEISNHDRWPNVPPDRFRRRRAACGAMV
ncbi:hypothetical protein [Pelagibius sp. Alg239-R121]|uniref:hypothetical protein n=1 Tax=Pelagibius sp. Alg239-R121 TaxID=2993448 RepID=UPI0024A70CF9|nr:hypothetical protein [Pelagibius sp. Alg239-R121]